MAKSDSLRNFKFRYVVGGNTRGLRFKTGAFAADSMAFGDDHVPYETIIDTVTRGNRVIIALAPEFAPSGKLAKSLNEGGLLVLEPRGIGARALEMAIDRECSTREAERLHRTLKAQGQEHLIRTEMCPVCDSTVDLSGLEATQYVYCRFCESIFSADRSQVTSGEQYRICDDCSMFDRIQAYPEFYFYFLLIVYGFSYKKRFLCDSCAHRLFLKALGLNLLFLIGLPTAIWVKIKSMVGREERFAALPEANALARAGQPREASLGYDAILRNQPNHPAILRNQAMGHLNAGDETTAIDLLRRSLASCNQYLPVVRMLR